MPKVLHPTPSSSLCLPPGRLWRRSKLPRETKSLVGRAIESICILVAAALVFLAIGELAIRAVSHIPFLAWRDFRHERAIGTINKAVEYDRLLGWRLRPHLRSAGFNTLDHGFRSIGDADAKVEQGGVLAVGSSFTAGSEVNDDQSWPAYLHQMTGWNVNNAGQGGYQGDQIVLLAEQLLPIVRPQVVVVDLIPGTILGTGYASSGWPKPYFTIENRSLVIHNSPVPESKGGAPNRIDIKWYLGHLATIDQFMATFAPTFWFTADGNSFVTVATDEVGVTCRLLARLDKEAERAQRAIACLSTIRRSRDCR